MRETIRAFFWALAVPLIALSAVIAWGPAGLSLLAVQSYVGQCCDRAGDVATVVFAVALAARVTARRRAVLSGAVPQPSLLLFCADVGESLLLPALVAERLLQPALLALVVGVPYVRELAWGLTLVVAPLAESIHASSAPPPESAPRK